MAQGMRGEAVAESDHFRNPVHAILDSVYSFRMTGVLAVQSNRGNKLTIEVIGASKPSFFVPDLQRLELLHDILIHLECSY